MKSKRKSKVSTQIKKNYKTIDRILRKLKENQQKINNNLFDKKKNYRELREYTERKYICILDI